MLNNKNQAIEPGTVVPYANFAFMSKHDVDAIVAAHPEIDFVNDPDDLHVHVIESMLSTIAQTIDPDNEFDFVEQSNNDYYFDIVVSIKDKSFTLNAIYYATCGTYNVIVHDKIDIANLPLTLPLPSNITALL